MIVLAFDIAYTSGWAVTAPDSPHGVIWGHFGVGGDGEEGIGRALFDFWRHLEEILDNHLVACLAWEKPLPGTKHLASFDEYVRGATGLLRLTAFQRNFQILPCDMKAVRRHFIGDGTRFDAKAQVWQRCKVLGYECANDDESDAIATWDYAVGIMKARAYAANPSGFGGSGGRALAAPRRARGHRRL